MTKIKSPDYVPNTVFAADVVIFTMVENQLQYLSIERSNEPFKGQRALPGGLVDKNETSRQTAERVLLNKAGVKNVFLEQLYSFDDINRDPRGRVISIAYYALVPYQNLVIETDHNTENPALESVAKLKQLAFDHKNIVEYANTRLRNKLLYTNAIFSLLPPSFTLAELHNAYQSILGRQLDKRNFRKKFLSLGLIEETNEKTVGVKHRPAELYKFKSNELIEIDRWI